MRNVAKKVTLSLLSALALTACGGGESGQNTKQPNPEQPSSNLTTSTLEGTAADNIIRHGEVRIYSWDGQEKEILFSTQTDEQGHYQATLETDSTFLKACVISGEYTEEASQITISLTEGDRLCAIAPRKQGVQHLMVTPETHLATALIEYQINSGNNDLANVVTHANNSIGSLFGYDILTTKPADLTSADIIDAQLNDSLRSGLWHAAFSSLALAAAEQNGLTTHNSLNSSLALHKAFYQDLSSDGKLDGQVLTSNGETLALGLDNFVLSANVFRTKLAEHLIRYVASTQNKTAIQVPDIINNAELLSQNISHLFHDNDHPMALDTDAPQVQFDIEENSYIQGQFQLGVTITDFTGIKQASYYLNDGQEINFDVSQPHLQIDTTQIADGELIIHFTAIDFLNNKAELNLVLQVANERPSLQLTSNKITNKSQYHFVAKVEKTTHALTSLKVNGENADYENHELSAKLNLQPGANTVNVTLLNEIGHEYHYSFAVMLDRVTPTIEAVDLSWVYREKDTSTYITPAFYRLNGLLVNQANLAAKQWPTLALNISDSDINGSYASSSNKLTASLSYFSDGATQASFTRSLNIPSDSLLWIPFSEEYLGEKWYEKNGEKRLVIQVNDEAGNSNQKEYTFHTLLSAPVVNPELSTHVQGDFDLVMHTQELEGIDQVIVQLDGEMLTWDWKNSATLPLNTTQLSDGKHRLTIQAIAGEETLYSKEVEFNVDNTAPVIHIDSPTLVSDNHYKLTGTVVEEGGLANLTATLNEHHYKLLQNTRIEQAMKLESGDNLIAVSAQDLAGNKSSAQQRVIFDSVDPCFQCMISDLGQQSIGQLDLYYLDFNVRHGISHDPDLSPMLLQKPIYLDDSVNSLHGLELNTETDLTVLQGKNYGMAHFRFNVSDSQSEGAVVTDATQLKTYLTVKFNDDTVVAEQLLTPLNPNNTQALHYLVPITQEFFSNGLIDLQPNDTVTAQFTVQDLAGRSTSKTYLFSVFNAPSSIQNPEIEGAIKSVSGTLNLNVTVKAEAGLSRISVSKTGLGNIFDWNSKEQTTLIKSLELPQQNATTDGMHSWTVSVTDLAGVTKTQTYSAEIDKTLPTLSGSGFNSSLTKGDLSFALTAQDNKGLASIKILNATNNSLLYSYTPNGQTSYAIAPPKQTTTGVHNWKVEVTDLAGNTFSKTYGAEIDKVAPTINVGSIPTATVGTPLTISGSVYDANLSSFVISVDLPGYPIKTMSYSSSGTFSDDFYLYGNEGPVTITFTAKDKLGQTTTITKTTTYNKPFGWTNIDTDRTCVGIPGNCASLSTNTITYNRDIASVRLESPKMSCFSPVNEKHTARVVTITSRILVGGSGCPSNEILLNVYVTAKNGEVSTLSMTAGKF